MVVGSYIKIKEETLSIPELVSNFFDAVFGNFLKAPWLEVEAEIGGKSTAQVTQERPAGFVPVTNPASPDMIIPLPILSATSRTEKYFLHVIFLGENYRLPVSKEIYASAEVGGVAKLKARFRSDGNIKAAHALEVTKKKLPEILV